jgi:hypothetical protein
MYVPNSAAIHYPQGNDWGTDRIAHFAELDTVAGAFGLDSLVDAKAPAWERLHAGRLRSMQLRPLAGGLVSDGRTYRTAGEDTYPGREEWVAARAAGAWLTTWLAHQQSLRIDDRPGQIVIDNADRGATVHGTWTSGTGQANGPQVFGRSVLYKAAGDGTARVTFTPRMTETRSYRLYAWWVAAPAQSTRTPFAVAHAAGTSTVLRNQRIAGGQWILLGAFRMGPGSSVTVSDLADGYVVGDAVLLDPA